MPPRRALAATALAVAATVVAVPAAACAQAAPSRTGTSPAGVAAAPRGARFVKPDSLVLKRRLTPLQYAVTQHDATETPYRNAFWDHHAAGIYVDVVSGEPLFSSRDKYDSQTGWPSFVRPLEPTNVVRHVDRTLGVERTEVRSAAGDSHLGHVFDDGPAPAGLRYCINSAALRFVPAERLRAEGYARYAAQFGR